MNESAPSPRKPPPMPWLGKLFALFMLGFFLMVALGLVAIYRHQSNAPRPEPLPFFPPAGETP